MVTSSLFFYVCTSAFPFNVLKNLHNKNNKTSVLGMIEEGRRKEIALVVCVKYLEVMTIWYHWYRCCYANTTVEKVLCKWGYRLNCTKAV